jgi:hypothetical protein
MIENVEQRLTTAIRLLKECLLTTVPPEFVQERVRTVRDIYENRSFLKQLPGSNDTVSHIANIILAAIRAQDRMRTMDCLKILRDLVRNTTLKKRLALPQNKEIMVHLLNKLEAIRAS